MSREIIAPFFTLCCKQHEFPRQKLKNFASKELTAIHLAECCLFADLKLTSVRHSSMFFEWNLRGVLWKLNGNFIASSFKWIILYAWRFGVHTEISVSNLTWYARDNTWLCQLQDTPAIGQDNSFRIDCVWRYPEQRPRNDNLSMIFGFLNRGYSCFI